MDNQNKQTEPAKEELTKTLLAVWALTATLAAVILAGLTISRLVMAQAGLQGVPERELPGNYQWTEAGQVTFITLYADHIFTKEGGPRYAFHRWEITRDGALLITWQTGLSRFTKIVGPGVFEGMNWNNNPLRMEMQH